MWNLFSRGRKWKEEKSYDEKVLLGDSGRRLLLLIIIKLLLLLSN